MDNNFTSIVFDVLTTLIENNKTEWTKDAQISVLRHLRNLGYNVHNDVKSLENFYGSYGNFELLYCGDGCAISIQKDFTNVTIYLYKKHDELTTKNLIDFYNSMGVQEPFEVWREGQNINCFDYGEIWNFSDSIYEIITITPNNEIKVWTPTTNVLK